MSRMGGVKEDLFVVVDAGTTSHLSFYLRYREGINETIQRHQHSIAAHEELQVLCHRSSLRKSAKASQQAFHEERIQVLQQQLQLLHGVLAAVNDHLLVCCPHVELNEVHVCLVCNNKVAR